MILPSRGPGTMAATMPGTMAGTMPWLSNLVGLWGLPGDPVAWVAFGLGIWLLGLAIAGKERWLFLDSDTESSERLWVRGWALLAAFLSLGYVAYYLRGGPRIIDATAYLQEARALANGHFGERIPFPAESFRGRFLVYDETNGNLTGIFPPGYPLLLSLGVRLGAPLVVGPLLAAGLVFATAWLARELCARTTLDPRARRLVTRVAVVANVLCATLRYHTADTMSHGLAALLVTTAFAAALTATRDSRANAGVSHVDRADRAAGAPRARTSPFVASLACGLAVGWLAATRLASAPPIALLVAALFIQKEHRKNYLPLALGLIPGVALLLASQAAATGSAFSSVQQLYYARSDGPPGCFRYGFGAGIGCQFEHGDFVRARLSSGYGIVSALGVTLRRLRAHLTDIENIEILALVPLAPLVLGTSARRATRYGLALVVLFVVGYSPFYFDGNYPGGGARFFADVLPTEHVLFALGAAALAERWGKYANYTQIAAALVGIGCVGFAVHSSFDHRALRDREEGRPMFEPDVLTRAGMRAGLIFVDTDHGFLAGHDPQVTDAKSGVVVARQRGDASDRLLYERLGAPPTYRYDRGSKTRPPRLVPFNVPEARVGGLIGYRFEAENEWPALTAERDPETDGYAIPAWASSGCTSADRVLRITTGKTGEAHVAIALPYPEERAYFLSVRIRGSGSKLHMLVRVGGVELDIPDPAEGSCVDFGPKEIRAPAASDSAISPPRSARVEITVRASPLFGSTPTEAPPIAAGATPEPMDRTSLAAMDLDALTLRP